MRSRIAIEIFDESGKPGVIQVFVNDPAAAIEFLQGVPRARNADEHNAEILEKNKEAFRQLEIFQESYKRNFKNESGGNDIAAER